MLIRPIIKSDNKPLATILREVLIEMNIPKIGSAYEDPEIDNMYKCHHCTYSSNRPSNLRKHEKFTHKQSEI